MKVLYAGPNFSIEGHCPTCNSRLLVYDKDWVDNKCTCEVCGGEIAKGQFRRTTPNWASPSPSQGGITFRSKGKRNFRSKRSPVVDPPVEITVNGGGGDTILPDIQKRSDFEPLASSTGNPRPTTDVIITAKN